MAKVSSARPASRGSQTGAPTARMTRSTRSQSHEPAEMTTTRQSPRKATQTATKTAPKKRGRAARGGAGDLDTVAEDAALEGQLAAEMHATNEEPLEELELARRASRNSGMSGTTAKTSFSQEEISELDAEVIVDVLPSLCSAANDLAKLIVVPDPKARAVLRKEIRTEGSRHNKLYKTRLATMNVNKPSFGSTEYIQPSIILRALIGVQDLNHVPPGPWRPDGVIYKINLASMVRTVLVAIPDNLVVDDEAYSAMARLAVAFPTAIAGPGFKVNAFDLALDLLTQLSIIRLQTFAADPSFNPAEVITTTFFDQDEEGEIFFRHRDDLYMTELGADDQISHSDAVRSRVDELVSAFDSSNPQAAIGSIRAQHQWESFVEKVVRYYLARKLELDEQIEAVGGVDQIMLDLSEEVERRTVSREAELKRQSLTQPGTTPKKGFGKEGIQRMMEMEARLSAASTAPAAAAPAPVPAADLRAASPDDWNRIEDDDYPPATTHAQSTARSTLAALHSVAATQRQNAAKGKKRSFVDPQPNAVRISFDDSQEDEYPGPAAVTQNKGPYYQNPVRLSSKRPLHAYVEDDVADDFEPTQDPGFEVDSRDTTAADRRRAAAPTQQSSRPGFSNAFTSSTAAASPPQTEAVPRSSNKRQRKNPGSSIPPPMPSIDPTENRSTSQAEAWQHAKVEARHNTVLARQRRPAQVRVPWSIEEEQALLDIIDAEGSEGISWSKLKNLDSALGDNARLARRSAEDIRFKARNMKETMLKARKPIPENWRHVQLDRKAIIKLQNLGIAYHQEQVRGSGPVFVDAQ